MSSRVARAMRFDAWNVGVVDAPIELLLHGPARPDVRWFPKPQQGTFLADPFPAAVAGEQSLFCELFDYRIGRGRIAMASLSDPTSLQIVHEPEVHVSFPFTLFHEDSVLCVPETSALSEISLYEVARHPVRLRKVATLVQGFRGCDSVLFRHQDRWWLFSTDAQTDANSSLYAWYSSSPFDVWHPHRLNPLLRDRRWARSAGTPFVHRGVAYRPVQDCTRSYGHRVLIRRIRALTPTRFQEETVAEIEPWADGPYPNGLHTVSKAGPLTLVDGKRQRSALCCPHVLRHRVRRLLARADFRSPPSSSAAVRPRPRRKGAARGAGLESPQYALGRAHDPDG